MSGLITSSITIMGVTSFVQENNADTTYPSDVWIRDHASTSQYMLQIYESEQTEDVAPLKKPTLSAQWCSCTLDAPCAGGTKFKSRSHHKRFSFACVA